MPQKTDRFWILYSVLAALVLIRFVPLFAGTTWLWGVGQLTLLPFGYLIAYQALTLLVLALPFVAVSATWGEKLAHGFDRSFYQSHRRLVYRGAMVTAFGVLFVLLRMPTHFLGDGYSYLTNIGSSVGRWVKWSEGGALLVVMWVQKLIGGNDIPSALLAFQIVSILSGLITVWLFFLIAGQLTVSPFKRLLVFGSLVLSGSLLLFFGYVESYPILWGPVTGFLYFGLKYRSTGRGLLLATILLVVAILLHLQTAMFVPALLYLFLSRGRGRRIYQNFRPLIWAGIGLVVIAGLILFYRAYSSNLSVENIFLYPFSGKPISPGYAMLSPRHLSDILNLFVLVVPLGFVFAAASIELVDRDGSGVNGAFLGLATAGSLLFLLVVDPSLSMPRDWDLFSLCFLGPGLWLANRVSGDSVSVRRLLLPALLLAVMSVKPFFLITLDRDRSVAQIRQIIDDNPDKSLGSMSILTTYYDMMGDKRASDSLGQRMAQVYPDFTTWRNAFKLLAAGKREAAFSAFSHARPDKFSKDFHSFLAAYYLQTGNVDSALGHAKMAVQLQKYVDVNYAPLAYAYIRMGDPDNAMKALRQGYALNARNREIIMSLALLHYSLGNFDSTLAYAAVYHQVDSQDPNYYYLSAKGYYGQHNLRGAYESARRYLQYDSLGAGFSENCRELRALLPALDSTGN